MQTVAKIFKNGQSQAVRIPKEFRFDTSEVYIDKQGDKVILTPKQSNDWTRFFETLETLRKDGSPIERANQGEYSERLAFE
ncbi:MAG: antitoxin [Wolinella sp.]